MENHFDKLMKSGYSVLTEKTVLWPKEFTVQHKIALLSKALEYFQEMELYRECAVLSKKIKSLTAPRKRKMEMTP